MQEEEWKPAASMISNIYVHVAKQSTSPLATNCLNQNWHSQQKGIINVGLFSALIFFLDLKTLIFQPPLELIWLWPLLDREIWDDTSLPNCTSCHFVLDLKKLDLTLGLLYVISKILYKENVNNVNILSKSKPPFSTSNSCNFIINFLNSASSSFTSSLCLYHSVRLDLQ